MTPASIPPSRQRRSGEPRAAPCPYMLPMSLLAGAIALGRDRGCGLHNISDYVLAGAVECSTADRPDWPVLSQSLLTTLLTTLEDCCRRDSRGVAAALLSPIEMAGIFAVSLLR